MSEQDSASDYTGPDEARVVTIARPKPHNIRDAADVEGVILIDMCRPTYFPFGMRYVRKLEACDWAKPFIIRTKQSGKKRSYRISPICFHILSKELPKGHLLCEGCSYVLQGRLCVKEGGCTPCIQAAKQRKQVVMHTLGWHREARSVLDRSHFLEGMLWCLIYG